MTPHILPGNMQREIVAIFVAALSARALAESGQCHASQIALLPRKKKFFFVAKEKKFADF